MKIQFNPDLPFQREAIDAIVDLFDGQEICQTNFTVAPLQQMGGLFAGMDQNDLGVGNRLRLLDEDIPSDAREAIIHAAQEYHHAMMKDYKYEAARQIKTHYQLFEKNIVVDSLSQGLIAALEFLNEAFEKGDVDKAVDVVKEYNIPKERYQPVVVSMVR